jgi:hypothetical protein
MPDPTRLVRVSLLLSIVLAVPAWAKTRVDTSSAGPVVSAESLRAQLVRKPLLLRGFYLNNRLEFDENGSVQGSPAVGSFSLCGIEVKRIRLTKRKLEIVGTRQALHFFGALAYEDDTKPFDRISLSKKPDITISIDRELVVVLKKKHIKKGEQAKDASSTAVEAATPVETAPILEPHTTLLPAHSAGLLYGALDRIFASTVDKSLIGTLPAYWQFYFASEPHPFAPDDGSILRVGEGVSSPRILIGIEPGSNDYAQKNNITGLSRFRAIVDATGHSQAVVVVRPIGFGLDEKAVDAILKSTFQPATHEGKPVASSVDLIVTFRIYSNMTRGSAVESLALMTGGEKSARGKGGPGATAGSVMSTARALRDTPAPAL